MFPKNLPSSLSTKVLSFVKKPVGLFLASYLVVLFFPAIYFVLSEYNEQLYFINSNTVANHYNLINFYSNIVFLVQIVIGISFSSILPMISISPLILNRTFVANRWLLYFACSVTLIYFLLYGLKKVLLIGSSIESMDFRTIGYNDVPRSYTMLLELMRKISFPFLLSYYFIYEERKKYVMVIFFFLLAAVSTLDRFPFLILALFFLYKRLYFTESITKTTLSMVLFLPVVMVIASLLTYLQHNQLDVGVAKILTSAFDFFVHRILLVPTSAATEIGIAYAEIHGYFGLAYSRLSWLFGAEYIGFDQQDSNFVAPVGVVADLYRNFGYSGVFFGGFILGWFVRWYSKNGKKLSQIRSNEKSSFIKGFMILNLSTYLIFGNLFTVGVFAMIIFLSLSQYTDIESAPAGALLGPKFTLIR